MQRVLPTYLTIDTSASMASRITEVENYILNAVDFLMENPLLAEITRVSIVTFNDQASLDLPLTDLTEVATLPPIKASGSTQYAPVFDLLRDVIVTDLRVLRSRDVVVQRPFIVFITDGPPVDPEDRWTRSYAFLRNAVRPIILAVALPGADTSLLRSMTQGDIVQVKHLEDASSYLGASLDSTIQSVAVSGVDIEDARSGRSNPLPYPDVEIW